MGTEDSNNKPLNRASLFRQLILAVFPIVPLFFHNWAGTAVVSLLSLLAILVDRARNRRRAVPFLLYLLLVWTIQAMSLTLILNLSPETGFRMSSLSVPEVAMEKWKEHDAKVDVSLQEWPESEYPWIKEFPPLKPGDPAPEIKTASVILAAHNEHTYLERTIRSILEESDPNQLIEIIVIDDASQPPLSDIIDKMTDVRSKIVVERQSERQGLIRSKSHGAALARGDLIIFLDAHVKPERNWLAPLFRHTNENWKRVVVPVIPILNGDSWKVESTAVGYKMMFDWGLGFNWFDDGDDWVPIMSGGLLAITRRYWHWSGEYDNLMLMWGAENIEQSVRIWLCGGEIVVARDSRVSHVFRPSFPYSVNHTQVNVNKVRLVEVWFDKYKDFFYRADPHARNLVPLMGDVSGRIKLKQKLQCKPFQYFVDRFRSVFDKRNMLPSRHFAIKDEKSGKCLEGHKDGTIGMRDCSLALGPSFANGFRFVPDGDKGMRSLQFPNLCFDANAISMDKKGVKILLYHCMNKNPNQKGWEIADGGIRWENNCAYMEPKTSHLTFGECTQRDGEFLGKKFNGHANHVFVIADEQRIDESLIGDTEELK